MSAGCSRIDCPVEGRDTPVRAARFTAGAFSAKFPVAIQRSPELVRRREALLPQRAELGVSPGYDSSTIVVKQQLDGTALDTFSQVVEAEL